MGSGEPAGGSLMIFVGKEHVRSVSAWGIGVMCTQPWFSSVTSTVYTIHQCMKTLIEPTRVSSLSCF